MSEQLEAFANHLLAEMDKREGHWRRTQDDPYQIANAVMVSIAETKEAIAAAMTRMNLPRAGGKGVKPTGKGIT